MNSKTILIIASAAVVALLAGGVFSSYNGLATSREATDKAWSDVESTYQRRADLIPSLVDVAKKASSNEKEILDDVVKARSAAISANVEVGDTEKLSEAQNEVTESLSRLIAITENYPEVSSTQAWLDLSAELAGTENRIFTARRDFNDVAEKYNSKIITLPSSLFAGVLGFDKVDYFKSEAGADKAVDLNLD